MGNVLIKEGDIVDGNKCSITARRYVLLQMIAKKNIK